MSKITAWHFLPKDRCLRWHGQGQPVEAGYIYTTDEPLVFLCASGFHGSRSALDALKYAPGPWVCRVRIWGDVKLGNDKLTGRHREVLAMADATSTLQEFARWAALQVAHLWNPHPDVLAYLKTGGEEQWHVAQARMRGHVWGGPAVDATIEALSPWLKTHPWEYARQAAHVARQATPNSNAYARMLDKQNTELERRLRKLLKARSQ